MKKEPFQYVHPLKGMPKVFIYGDSISVGYTKTVRSELKDLVGVFRLYENSGSSWNFIKSGKK